MNGYEFLTVLVVLVFASFVFWLLKDANWKSFRLRVPGAEFSAEMEPKPVRFGKELTDEIALATAHLDVIVSTHASGVVTTAPAGEVDLGDQAVAADELTVDKTPGTSGWLQAVTEDLHRRYESDEQIRRARLEVALNDAAEWGWTIAHMSIFQNFPHPVVEWDGDGNPTIVYGDTDPVRFGVVREAARASLWAEGFVEDETP